MTTSLSPHAAETDRIPRRVLVCSPLVPLLVLTGLAMLAVVPLGILVHATFREGRLRRLRPWVAILAGSYATPLALWAVLPDRAPSLTKDMHPAFVPIIVTAGLVLLLALTHLWLGGRRVTLRAGSAAS